MIANAACRVCREDRWTHVTDGGIRWRLCYRCAACAVNCGFAATDCRTREPLTAEQALSVALEGKQ